MRTCWVCSSTGICSHREPELVEFYMARLAAHLAILARAEDQAAATRRKPASIAPPALKSLRAVTKA